MGPGCEPIRLGIRYCGGCNPAIDRGEVTEEILRHLARAGIEYKVVYEGGEEAPDFWLTISGCEIDCTSRKDSLPEVVVAGHTVDRWQVASKDEIVVRACRRIAGLASLISRSAETGLNSFPD